MRFKSLLTRDRAHRDLVQVDVKKQMRSMSSSGRCVRVSVGVGDVMTIYEKNTVHMRRARKT